MPPITPPITLPIILASILSTGCGAAEASSDPPDTPSDKDDVTPKPPEEQHFCCQSVNHKNKTGDGCTAISGTLEVINSCSKVLYCPGFWTKDDGVVTCE